MEVTIFRGQELWESLFIEFYEVRTWGLGGGGGMHATMRGQDISIHTRSEPPLKTSLHSIFCRFGIFRTGRSSILVALSRFDVSGTNGQSCINV